MNNCSMASFISEICELSWLPSVFVMQEAIIGRFTPQALPKAVLLEMKQKETFFRYWGEYLFFANSGKTGQNLYGVGVRGHYDDFGIAWVKEPLPLFRVLMHSLIPFFSCL